MTEQEMRVKQADEILQYIETTLLSQATFKFWEDRCRVADKITELYKMAIRPNTDTVEQTEEIR